MNPSIAPMYFRFQTPRQTEAKLFLLQNRALVIVRMTELRSTVSNIQKHRKVQHRPQFDVFAKHASLVQSIHFLCTTPHPRSVYQKEMFLREGSYSFANPTISNFPATEIDKKMSSPSSFHKLAKFQDLPMRP